MNPRAITQYQFLLLSKIEALTVHSADVYDSGVVEPLLNRNAVLDIIKDHYQDVANIEAGLQILAEREASISFYGGYVKIKFPDCPAFTADNLREALAIAIKLTPKEGR